MKSDLDTDCKSLLNIDCLQIRHEFMINLECTLKSFVNRLKKDVVK